MNRLESARALIRAAVARAPDRSLIVAFSGGKDSQVVLDLAAPIVKAAGGRIVGWFMYFVRDLEVMKPGLEWARRRYKIDIVQTPHFDLARLMREAVYRHPVLGIRDRVKNIRLADLEAVVRDKTGLEWIASGQKAIDSLERRGMIKSQAIPGLNEKQHRVWPLAWWNNTDVKAYNARAGIPLPPQIGPKRSSGIGLDIDTLEYLKQHHPRDYERLCEVFPLAPGILVREKMRAAEKGQIDGSHEKGIAAGR